MKNKQSPWGKIDHFYQITPWLTWVSTSSHGGVKLDRKHNAMIPDYARCYGGWYEEDCEWAIAFCFLKNKIIKDMNQHYENYEWLNSMLSNCEKVLRDNYPSLYESFFNTILNEGESRAKDEYIWNEINKDNYKLYCAIGMINNVKVLLKKSREGTEENWYMISKDLYLSKKERFGWVFSKEEIKHLRKIYE